MAGIKRLPLLAALATSLVAGSACAHHSKVVYVYVPTPPPPAVREVVTGAPGPRYVWVPGHHHWNGHQYVWISGRWQLPPEHRAHWVKGHWAHDRHGYYWIDGHWA